MKRRENQLERRLLELRVWVDGNPATIVGHRRAAMVGIEHDFDAGRMPIDRLVDRVVDDLPEKMVIPVGIGAPDVHRRTFADRLQALENVDVFRGIRHYSSGKTGISGS